MKILKQSHKARLGTFQCKHGTFETPNFMPVGTRGSVKGIDTDRLSEIGAQIMLVNTYHLWLRPGHEQVAALGGIHKFVDWSGPILSDSGGFQVFSLKGIRKLTEECVEFRSHIDGSRQSLSPEKAIHIQETLGVDIAMVLDECPSMDLSYAETLRSLELTLRWAQRCQQARTKPEDTKVFGITQGGKHADLRKRSAEELALLNFDGYAIGGLSVGEPKEVMYEVLSYHVDQLPADKIRYLMGVGTPQDIVEAVSRGVDLFDCVMPTRSGRFGRAYVSGDLPYLNIKNKIYRDDLKPLDESCKCLACRKYSRAYVHHLFRVEEMLGPVLLSIHNLTHYMDLMRKIRESINADTFSELYQNEQRRWSQAPLLEQI